MQLLARLVTDLDHSATAAQQQVALLHYFAQAEAADAAWALHLLAGGSTGLRIPHATLRAATQQATGLPTWLLDECLSATGELAEALALSWPDAGTTLPPVPRLAVWMQERLPSLRGQTPEAQLPRLLDWFSALDRAGRLVLARLLGGGLRAGLPLLQLQQALATHAGLDTRVMAQRMEAHMAAQAESKVQPGADRYQALLAPTPSSPPQAGGLPCAWTPRLPLALRGPTPATLQQQLGPADGWSAQWSYGGQRAQLVKREGQIWLWSADEALISARFPEVLAHAAALPDGSVLDGELLIWPAGDPAPAAPELLRQRLQRKSLNARSLSSAPAVFLVHELLELHGQDQRQQPGQLRRARLEQLLSGTPASSTALRLPTARAGDDWAGLQAWHQQGRALGAAALLLQRDHSPPGLPAAPVPDRLWPLPALRARVLLLYAQADPTGPGAGGSELSLAVWNRAPQDPAEIEAVLAAISRREPPAAGALQLVVVARVSSKQDLERDKTDGPDQNGDEGLSEAALADLNTVIRASTVQKFGPVRSLLPSVVLELGYARLHTSARHKSGLLLQSPRVLAWLREQPLSVVDSLSTLQALPN